MESIQNIEVENVDSKVVNKRIKAPERYLPDGTYNTKPLSPSYFRDYYQKTKSEVTCEHCKGVFCHKVNYAKHLKRSNRCQRLRTVALEQVLV